MDDQDKLLDDIRGSIMDMQKEITILHSACCATNSPIKDEVLSAAEKVGVDVSIKELSDLSGTMPYGTLDFPSLVINGELYSYRQNSQPEQIQDGGCCGCCQPARSPASRHLPRPAHHQKRCHLR